MENEYQEPVLTLEEKAQNLVKALSNFVGGYPNEEKATAFINAFCCEHRTHQQANFRLMMKLVEHMASDKYRFDGRNEQARGVAKRLIKGHEMEFQKELITQGTSPERAAEYAGENGEYFLPSRFLGVI